MRFSGADRWGELGMELAPWRTTAFSGGNALANGAGTWAPHHWVWMGQVQEFGPKLQKAKPKTRNPWKTGTASVTRLVGWLIGGFFIHGCARCAMRVRLRNEHGRGSWVTRTRF